MIRAPFSRLVRYFSKDPYDSQNLEKFKALGHDYADARTFNNFSIRELKKRVPQPLWEEITKGDPLYSNPELADIWDIQDVKPFAYKYLPAYLTRPAIALNQREREARRLTIEFSKQEKELKSEREAQRSVFPLLTTDDFELNVGLLLMRSPIWLLVDDEDIAFFRTRYNAYKAHKLCYQFSDRMEPNRMIKGLQNERDIRKKELERKLEEGEEIEYDPVKGSTHYLEADRWDDDPRSIAYAGGYKVYLLVKEKKTQQWGFPSAPLYGETLFEDTKSLILKDLLGEQVKVHQWGPRPVGVYSAQFEQLEKRERPKYFQEDVYSLYLKRLKILFPKAKETDLTKYLVRKYDMSPHPEPRIREIKGKKTFYFLSHYLSGDIHLRDTEQYDDFAWVPKVEFNKYFSLQDFAQFSRFASAF